VVHPQDKVRNQSKSINSRDASLFRVSYLKLGVGEIITSEVIVKLFNILVGN